jgi:hypothetical protein
MSMVEIFYFSNESISIYDRTWIWMWNVKFQIEYLCEMSNCIIIESEKNVYLVFIFCYEWIILTLFIQAQMKPSRSKKNLCFGTRIYP